MFSQSREERLQSELIRLEQRRQKEQEREATIELELKKIREKKNAIFGPDAVDIGASHPSLHMERHSLGPSLSQNQPSGHQVSQPPPGMVFSYRQPQPPRLAPEPTCAQAVDPQGLNSVYQ